MLYCSKSCLEIGFCASKECFVILANFQTFTQIPTCVCLLFCKLAFCLLTFVQFVTHNKGHKKCQNVKSNGKVSANNDNT